MVLLHRFAIVDTMHCCANGLPHRAMGRAFWPGDTNFVMDLRAMDLRAMDLRPHVRILLGHSSFVGLSMFHRDHTATPLSFGKNLLALLHPRFFLWSFRCEPAVLFVHEILVVLRRCFLLSHFSFVSGSPLFLHRRLSLLVVLLRVQVVLLLQVRRCGFSLLVGERFVTFWRCCLRVCCLWPLVQTWPSLWFLLLPLFLKVGVALSL